MHKAKLFTLRKVRGDVVDRQLHSGNFSQLLRLEFQFQILLLTPSPIQRCLKNPRLNLPRKKPRFNFLFFNA